MKLISLYFLIVFIPISFEGFLDSWKKLKNLASKAHKSKNKNLNFLGYDKNEYPGVNEESIKINEEKWSDYYNCLKDQNENLGKYLTIPPQAILGFEGNYVKLECKICISLIQEKDVDSIVWEWVPQGKKYFEPIYITENVVISPTEKALHLYNLQLENTGQYMCTLGDTMTAPYFLTVINPSDKEMTEVHPPDSVVGPYPKSPELVHNQNLVIDTEWSEWSICSKCNQVGKRHKLGYCSIYPRKIEEPELTDVDSGSVEKPAEDKGVLLLDMELFFIFKFGIPCRSHILPKAFRDMEEVKQRKNEVMIGYCKQKCQQSLLFEVKDKSGRVIERANNSAGIYSMLQPLPPLEPPVERILQYGVKGKPVVLHCPGNLNSDIPVHWQIGDKNLIPELISKESNNRIFISITDKIHIKNARVGDSNIYSCWQQNNLAGTVRLYVEKKLEMNFVQHLMLFGIVVILGVFLWVFAKAFVGRKYADV